MTADAPTETNPHEPSSAAQFRTEVLREHRILLHETRQALHSLGERMALLESVQKTIREDVTHLKAEQAGTRSVERQVHDLQHWAEEAKEPLDAAARLAMATSGARAIMVVIFAAATGILAVAGVLQLMQGAWRNLWH